MAEGSERRNEYRLTEKGQALYPVLVALMHWRPWSGTLPLRLVEHRSGKPIEPVGLRVGRALGLRDVRQPGPGATADTIHTPSAQPPSR